MPLLLVLVPLLALIGCEIVPASVEKADIEDALVNGRLKTVCHGLNMKDDEVRRYAASTLEELEDPIARECICEHATTAAGTWDAAVLSGLKGTTRDDLVACFIPFVDRRDDPARNELIVALDLTAAKSVDAVMVRLAGDPSEPSEVRLRAIGSLKGTGDAATLDLLVRLLASDSDAPARAAAAAALVGQKGSDAVVQALRSAVTGDAEGEVRAAALATLKSFNIPDADEMLCGAMLRDPSPAVRTAAVLAYRGSKRDDAMNCVRARALTTEEDDGVRAAVLAVLGSSPSQVAADTLCEAIPFWVRSYVEDKHPVDGVGLDIIKAQNDRDFERSYECVAKAVRGSGYTCRGRQYVGAWMRELGGTAGVPRCPGDPPVEVIVGGE